MSSTDRELAASLPEPGAAGSTVATEGTVVPGAAEPGAVLLAAAWSTATPAPGRERFLRELLAAGAPAGARAEIYAPGGSGCTFDGGVVWRRLPSPAPNRRAAEALLDLEPGTFERALALAHPPSSAAVAMLAATDAALLIEPGAFAAAREVLCGAHPRRTALALVPGVASGPIASAERRAARALAPLVDCTFAPTPLEARWLEPPDVPVPVARGAGEEPLGECPGGPRIARREGVCPVVVTGLPFPRPTRTTRPPRARRQLPLVVVLDGWEEPDVARPLGYLADLLARARRDILTLRLGAASAALASRSPHGARSWEALGSSPDRPSFWSIVATAACLVDLNATDLLARNALEAMCLGVPVLAPAGTAAAAHAELGGGGLWFATPAELLEAVTALVGDARLATDVGGAASSWAEPLLPGPADFGHRVQSALHAPPVRRADPRSVT